MTPICRALLVSLAWLGPSAGCFSDECDDCAAGPSTEGTGDGSTDTGDGSTDTGDGSTDTGDDSTDDSTDTGEQQPPEAPGLQLSLSPIKQFDFTWTPALGVEYYQLLEQATSTADYIQVGQDMTSTATSLIVPLHLRADASYVVRACNEFGCTDSAAVDVVGSMVEAIGYFKATNPSQLATFGASVAVAADGNTMAVGGTGSVAVFVRDESGGWMKQAQVLAENYTASDEFGWSVALSADGSTLAVGAPFEDSDATGIDGSEDNNLASDAGAVFVFKRNAMNAWAQQAYIKASNPDSNDEFGWSVALSADGSVLAVGARRESSNATGSGGDQANNLAFDSGAVYVFVRDEWEAWSQNAYLKASDTSAADAFGSSLALSSDGKMLAVGAPGEDGLGSGSGAVYVLVRTGMNAWTQQAYIKASNPGANDSFGSTLALSGDGLTLAVGAAGEDSNATGIDGFEDNDWATSAGAAYVFARVDTNTWVQQAYVKASNTDPGDNFGWSIALSADGNLLAVGAEREDSSAVGIEGDPANQIADVGAVYVFARDQAAVWTQQAYVKAGNSDEDDRFGSAVALSGDGSTLAVGAPREDGNGKDVGGNPADNSVLNAGAIYLY